MNERPAQTFHLAIPCRDVDEAARFYSEHLGCRIGRRRGNYVILDFFGAQIVCHLAPDKIDDTPEMYPRHYGIVFRDKPAFGAVLEKAKSTSTPFFREPFVRFQGLPEEHHSFFLRDPSNNLVEFKHYENAERMF